MTRSGLTAEYEIRAAYSEATIRVYQAFSPEIAQPALRAGTFVPPFRMERMTWIKPSFNWMMYRSGYGSKPGQEVVLGIDIGRGGFEWALASAALARYAPSANLSYEEWRSNLERFPVRVQWDPERDYRLNVIERVRAIQIGLSGEAVERYVKEWITRIEDVTEIAHRLGEDVKGGVVPDSLPDKRELAYPLPNSIKERICKK